LVKAAFNRESLFTSILDVNIRKKLVKCYIWSIAMCGVETRTPRKADQKYLERTQMRCWRRIENISWTYRVRNEQILRKIKEGRNILRAKYNKTRKAIWIGHTSRRNCLLKLLIEEKIEVRIEVKGKRRRRRKQLLDEFREK
jgi:hypothetical protein